VILYLWEQPLTLLLTPCSLHISHSGPNKSFSMVSIEPTPAILKRSSPMIPGEFSWPFPMIPFEFPVFMIPSDPINSETPPSFSTLFSSIISQPTGRVILGCSEHPTAHSPESPLLYSL
jgi:hypothetical protein